MSSLRTASTHAATLVGTVAAIAAIGGGTAALASASDGTAAHPHTVTITDCTGHQVTRPSSFVLACGDADTALGRLHWSDWGTSRATATGTETVNLCEPDCAAGKTARFGVDVTAERVRGEHGGRRYTRLVVHATGRRPKGVPATETWTPRAYR